MGYQVATEIPLACWPLVIGAVGYALRLTALVLRDLADIVIGNPGSFQSSRQQDTEKTAASTPSKGRQPKPDKIPAADQMPGGISASVALYHQVLSRPIGQQWGSSPKGAGVFLGTFCTSKKRPARGCGNPQAERLNRCIRRHHPPKSPAGATGKNKQRLCLTKRQRRLHPLRYHSSCPKKRGRSKL